MYLGLTTWMGRTKIGGPGLVAAAGLMRDCVIQETVMPAKFIETDLHGVLVVDSPVFRDDRGFFTEAYSARAWKEAGLDVSFVQDNLSCSSKGVVRGMHYQIEPDGMGKLVRVVQGAAFDVAVDIRTGSPTFGKWVGMTLSAENSLCLWIPAGFAHGFMALEDNTLMYYKSTALYAPKSERAILFDDPAIGIEWPTAPSSVSPKDADAPPLADAEYNFTFED